MEKIFETNFRFHLKQRTMGEVKHLVFSNFPLVSTKFSFMEEDWAQRYSFMQFWDFTDIS